VLTPELLAALDQLLGDRGHLAANGHAPADPAAPATCHLTLEDEDLLPLIAERTLASGARLYALTPRRISLEQLFLDVVGTEDSGQ
jgi:ABC-2 type transport system ATP-binding protein